MSSPAPTDRQPRLNIFALPTRTNLLFALIVLVVALPALASLAGDTPLCGPCFVFWLILLPVWSFLRRPEVEVRRYGMTDLAQSYPQLATRIERLVEFSQVRRVPRLMLSNEKGIAPRTFGTLTRHYLVIPLARAADLEADLNSTDALKRSGAEAIILHELSHLANRDIAPTFFARSLLVMTIGFASLSWFMSVLTPFVYNSVIRFFDISSMWSPDLLKIIQSSNPDAAQILSNPLPIGPEAWLRYEAFTLSAYWPLILGSLFLLIVFWRALLRTRELYADARVGAWQATPAFIQRELPREAARHALQLPASPPGLPFVAEVRSFFNRLNGWRFFATHPSRATRAECLAQPDRIYGSDASIGLTTGATVVLLNLMLDSLLLSRYLRSPNATLPFVLGFVIISLSLIPQVCASTASLPNFRRKVTRITLLYTIIKIVPQYLLGVMIALAVTLDPRSIDQAAFSLVGWGGEIVPQLGFPPAFIIDVYVIRPAILFTLVMPLTLIIFLLIDSWLKRASLTWYGAPIIRHHPIALFWGVTGWLALILWFVILPFYNVVTVPTAYSLTDPLTLGLMSITVGLSIGLGLWFSHQHRRFARQCPKCHDLVPGEYQLGKHCPHCDELLHPWLSTAQSVSTRSDFLQQQV
jgi:hypothetical protein